MRITQLTQLRPERRLLQKLQQVAVRRVGFEMLPEDAEDGGMEHGGVIHGSQANSFLPIPAGLSASVLGAVHNIVPDEIGRLEDLGCPA